VKNINSTTTIEKFYRTYLKLHTSLLRAKAADPRSAGSMESKVSINANAGAGKSLNVSATHRL
jgi:hypothetical protein